MRELNLRELESVSGGWTTPDGIEDPFGNDSRSLTIPGFDESQNSGGTGGPVVIGGEGGSNGVDSVSVGIDTDGDGESDITAETNYDTGEWSAEYTFDNGVSIGVSNNTDGGSNTPGNSGTFGTITIPF